jgi:hypothetical protein
VRSVRNIGDGGLLDAHAVLNKALGGFLGSPEMPDRAEAEAPPQSLV